MPGCDCHPVQWKNRPGYRLSNGKIELTVLLGGGHIADFRLYGSPLNTLWEPPWTTIDPHTFSLPKHQALYGDISVGPFLAGYTGHAVVLGYFGMPSLAEAAARLPLHGEAASAKWKVVSTEEGIDSVALTLEVELPVYKLHFRRTITVKANASTAAIHETVLNRQDSEIALQWVQHAGFGEPFFTKADASLFVPVWRAITWPLGYEGRELLPNDTEFSWPIAPTVAGGQVDLATPFQQDHTGFVASLLMPADRHHAFVAIHTRQHDLIAGYCFDRTRFPWIVLWEENRARSHPPWNGVTRVRGVEFGTSPMPLGLDHARKMRTLFDTPVLTSIPPNSELSTAYEIFVSQAPSCWKTISDVVKSEGALAIRDGGAGEIRLKSSLPSEFVTRRGNA
jgi:hypothetical protein